jgi:hypothetical protein
MSVNSTLLTKAGCAIVLSIFLVCCGGDTEEHRLTASPVATLDEKAVLRESMLQALGTDHENVPRLKKISYSDPEAGDITIIWAIKDAGSQTATKADAQMDAVNILTVLKNNKTRFIYVILIGTFSTQDGAELQAMSLGFNKSKLDRVDWEEFQFSDIYDLADVAEVADGWK